MKICKIVNNNFSWVMFVDEQAVSFSGRHNAEYFASHYRKLGYEVEFNVDDEGVPVC